MRVYFHYNTYIHTLTIAYVCIIIIVDHKNENISRTSQELDGYEIIEESLDVRINKKEASNEKIKRRSAMRLNAINKIRRIWRDGFIKQCNSFHGVLPLCLRNRDTDNKLNGSATY